MRICTILGCGKKHYAKGLCEKHWDKQWCEKNKEKLKEKAAATYLARAERDKAALAKEYAVNPEKFLERGRRYYAKYRTERLERMRKWRSEHKQLHKELQSAWKKKNLFRVKAVMSVWQKKNAGKIHAKTAARLAAKLHATPKWANMFFIEEAYNLAVLRSKTLGFSWHVDHRVPLQSALVCGLHVEHNLQVIPSRDNIRKGNKWWPDMPTVDTLK